MKELILITFLLLSSQVQAAEPPFWFYPALKVDSPDDLAVFVVADDDCFITKDEVKELVSGV